MSGAFDNVRIGGELAVVRNEESVSRSQQLTKLIEHCALDYCRLDFVGHFPEFGRRSLTCRWRGSGLCQRGGRTRRCGWHSG